MSLSLTQVKTLLDSLAKVSQNIVELGFNVNGTALTTGRTLAIVDSQCAADLGPAFNPAVSYLGTFMNLWQPRFTALEAHLGGINTYLTAQDSRASEFLRNYFGYPLLPLNTFCQTNVKLSDFTVTGASTGTTTLNDGFAVGTAGKVDNTKYGKIWLQCTITTLIGAGVVTVTVVGTNITGGAVTKTATISANAAVSTTYAVGTTGTSADHFASITSISITGGTSGAFKVETIVERVIAL